MPHLKRPRTRHVPEQVPIPRPGQVPGSAGGHAGPVDDWTRLRRFLVLGSERGSYDASGWSPTRANAQALERCIRADGRRAVAEIVRVSDAGRAPRNDPALFGLAMAAGLGDADTRRAALDALPRVARTAAHLFRFAAFVDGFRGWGRSLRRAVGQLVRGAAGRGARLPGGHVTAGARASPTATSCGARTPRGGCPRATRPSP